MVKIIIGAIIAFLTKSNVDYDVGQSTHQNIEYDAIGSAGDSIIIALIVLIAIAVVALGIIVFNTFKEEPDNSEYRDISKELFDEDYYDFQTPVRQFEYGRRRLSITNAITGYKKEFYLPACIRVGRNAVCDFVIPDMCVSQTHFMINMRDDRAFATDCNSTNGTVINGRYIQNETEIYHGSVISAGRTQLLIDM